MADVKKCDRCGTIYTGDNCTLIMSDSYTFRTYDLCQSCMTEFKEFMENKDA